MTGNTRTLILLVAAAVVACHLCIAHANDVVLTLEDPNGGERLVAGQTYTITWQGPEEINNVLLEYSSNNGSEWTQVDANAPNTGAYDWLVPHTTSNQCLVRISDANDPDVNDVSDSVFAVYICYLAYDLNHDCINRDLDTERQ